MTITDWLGLWPYLRDVAAGGAAGFALYTYHRSQRQRRAEWLDSLYVRFYEQPPYKRMRRLLDYGTQPDLTQLCTAVESGIETDACEELVNYLNFFEFLGSLKALGQISDREMDMLFEYYIRQLNDHPFVVTFVEAHGFENLAALLRARRNAVARQGVDSTTP